jgi:protein O-GlcNAc transferase
MKEFEKALEHIKRGELQSAEEILLQIATGAPHNFDANHMLGVVCGKLNKFQRADKFFQISISIDPSFPPLYQNYGLFLSKMKQFHKAIEQFNIALRLLPNFAPVYSDRGNALEKMNKLDEAIADHNRAIALAPRIFGFYNNRGNVFLRKKRFTEALSDFERAIELNPNFADAYCGRGNVLTELNRYDDAFAAYDKALSFKPDLAEAWLGRGNVFTNLKRHDDAFAAYDKALSLKSDLAEAWLGRGNVFTNLKRHDDAFAAYDKALSLKSDLAEAWLGRGNVFTNLKRHDDAFAAYDKAFSIKPDLEGAEGARLHSKMHSCNWTQFKTELLRLTNNVKASKPNTDPFILLALSDSPGDHLQCARIWASKNNPLQQTRMWRGEIYKHDKIRVAYVSCDFREHPVAYLIAQTFELHDRTKFDVIALSLGPDDSSIMRQRVIKSVDEFVDCRKLGDSEIAQMIARVEVDVLVDLMGFTRDSRTDIFASRAAPIQVNYLGYPGTMGAGYFDYIIGDKTIFTELDEQFYSEKLIRFPYSYQPNDRKRSISDRAFERRDFGLPKDSFVFSCFNNNYKILPDVFDCWMRILKRLDNSVLWLSWGSADSAASNLRNEAAKRQVDPERLIFAKRLPLSEEHLARLRLADLFLDTLPYNAHATASDALWAGLPVLTQMGQTFAGRVAASLLRAIGLPELITYTREDYEALAIELALNRNKLLNIKEKLNRNRLTTPLFDTALFTKHLETAYEAMYSRYLTKLPPDHIDIKPLPLRDIHRRALR